MKIKSLTVVAASFALSFTLFSSCKKDTVPEIPPVDSTQIANLKEGLLLYLPFSGNFADSSGNNNPTTGVGGAALTADQSGTASSALNGTGSGQKVVVTNNGSIKFDTAYTISMNVMLRSYQRSSFFDMVKDATGDGWVFGVGTDIGSTNILNMNTVDTTGNCSTTVQPYNSQLFSSTTALQPGTWYNIICVFNKGVSRIYINGQLNATLTTPNRFVPECMSSNITVGGWWSGDPASINGKLDEVRLYNRPLKAVEIARLAQGFPLQTTEPVADLKRGLLLYLPFSGNFADSSGNNNQTAAVDGASLTYDAHGYANSAFGGTGNGERVVVTNNGSIKFDTAFTVSMAISLKTNSQQDFVSMIKRATGTGFSFGVGNGLPGVTKVNFTVAKTNAGCDDIMSPANSVGDSSSLELQPDAWYNLVVTFHKGTLNMYANGLLVSSKTGGSNTVPVCPGAEIIIGGWWDGDPASINGKMDNVRLYDRVLLPEEIAMLSQHYQPGSNSVRQVVNR
jgi:hypothetical protein